MDGYERLMDKEAQQEIERIGGADIVVGLPSYNGAAPASDFVHAVATGLSRHFSNAKAVLVSFHEGPTMLAPEAESDTGNRQRWHLQLSQKDPLAVGVATSPFEGTVKGRVLRTILMTAHTLEAKACAVIENGYHSITPEWVELLVRPILEQNFEYVAPLYRRHKYDGTLTNSIVYPLTRALYGLRVRQPSGGDFGFSDRFIAHCLATDIWDSDTAKYGTDIWMTTMALAEGYSVCQASLGGKLHEAKGTPTNLTLLLRQVVGSVFSLMELYEATWQNVRTSTPVPIIGKVFELGLEPVQVNVERMMKAMHLGLKDLLPLWEQILAQNTLDDLYQVEGIAEGDFRFPGDLWVRVVYDFALAYHNRVLHRHHLIAALRPLYLGRVASFISETLESSSAEVEDRIEALCRRFEALKPYLVEQWRQGQ